MNTTGRILCHFSCGAASAVAAKITCGAYAKTRTVEVINFYLSADEHPDSQRFMKDIEKWIGQPIIQIRGKYKTVEEAWRKEKFIVSPYGASCTRTMKRELSDAYQRPDDIHVLGFTNDEAVRAVDFEGFRPEMECLWVLIQGGITKEDCYKIIKAAGIELPEMYKLGYEHNNCIGCCKGGKGYWNKIRVDFPEVFASRAKVQRDLGVQFGGGKYRFWLDELKGDEGNAQKDQPMECGVVCYQYEQLLDLTINGIEKEKVQP